MEPALMEAMLDADECHWWYRGRRRVLRAELDRLDLPAEAQILDAGCGSGRTLVQLADYGTVSGVELSPRAAEVAGARGVGEVRVGRLESIPWSGSSFDLVTCLDVIEHTPDDRAALADLRRVTRAGGTLIVTVPAYPALWSRHDEDNHHFRRYTRTALRSAARATGWDVVRESSFNSVLLAPAAAVRLAQRRRPEIDGAERSDLERGQGWLNRALEWPLAAEAGWLSRGGTLPFGLSLLAVMSR
jgi:SAM-dependent methyltransferase